MAERRKIDVVVCLTSDRIIRLFGVTDKEEIGGMLNFCGENGFMAEFPLSHIYMVFEANEWERHDKECLKHTN